MYIYHRYVYILYIVYVYVNVCMYLVKVQAVGKVQTMFLQKFCKL